MPTTRRMLRVCACVIVWRIWDAHRLQQLRCPVSQWSLLVFFLFFFLRFKSAALLQSLGAAVHQRKQTTVTVPQRSYRDG